MLFDNVDDPEVPVTEYFPRDGKYDVILTTRHEAVVRLARGKDSDCEIAHMDSNEAFELLLRTARLQNRAIQLTEKMAAIGLLQVCTNNCEH